MSQSRGGSLLEASLNTASGFVVALIVWHFVAAWYGIPMPLQTNIEITTIFVAAALQLGGKLAVSVGDVRSAARGSGARYNDGKPPLELIPLRILAAAWRGGQTDAQAGALEALERLGAWQEGGEEGELYAALRAIGNPFDAAARVLDYGRRKYAAWNWAKGMAWSIALGCAARHLEAILRGEPDDPESGLPHAGHVACNIVFLIQYHRTFPEGDDRPTNLGASAPPDPAPPADEPE